MTQVSDVAPGPLVIIIVNIRMITPYEYKILERDVKQQIE